MNRDIEVTPVRVQPADDSERTVRSRTGPMTWSFTPVGAATVAATDVLAVSGDVFGPATWLLLSVPCALLGGAVVLVSEYRESRRWLYSIAKAAVAGALILVPLPVGGLVGGGASLGHRLLRRDGGEGR